MQPSGRATETAFNLVYEARGARARLSLQ